MSKTTIIIHTNKLLPYSETFIKTHIEMLHNYNVHVLASEILTDGLKVKVLGKTILNSGKFGWVRDCLFKLGMLTPQLRQELKATNAQLVHSHFGQNGFSSLPVAQLLDIPHITTFHGFDITVDDFSVSNVGRLHNRFRKNIKDLQLGGTKFLAVSEFIKNKLIALGFENDKIETHYLGIDVDQFSRKNQIRQNFRVICVGRHIECKGHTYLLEAMQIVQRALPETELVIIGDGPMREALESYAQTLKVNCRFVGKISSADVRNELEEASIYCQPSIRLPNGQEEALALTILEAQAMNIPAIVFNTGGMPEAIVDGKSGFVVEEKNVRSLAEKIMFLLENKETWKSFSDYAKDQVAERHNIHKQTIKLQNIYADCLKKFEKQ